MAIYMRRGKDAERLAVVALAAVLVALVIIIKKIAG